MRTEHFTKATLIEMPSCFLDPKGNFIFHEFSRELGVHEEMACDILDAIDESYQLDNYKKIREHGYTYQYLESLGYWRYSHWIGNYGIFNGETKLMSHAQKLAIREFCKVNGTTWETVVRG